VFTVSGDGTHTVEYRSTDAAGNEESVRNLQVKIDTTPPATTANLSGTAGNNGWWRSDVQVTLIAADETSGVAATQYQVDDGTWEIYSTTFVVAEGVHLVGYYSLDRAGNAESVCTQTLRIDTVPPRTTAILSGTLGLNGWYTDTVTVTLVATDTTSGVAQVLLNDNEYAGPVVVTDDGRYAWPYFSNDLAGNEEPTHTLSFNLDTTLPQVSVTGGAFCPGCGEILLIQPRAADAISGIGAWRLEITSTRGLVRAWEGNSPPTSIPWDGRNGSGNLVGAGIYELQLRAQDEAGWSATTTGQVRVTDAPPPPAPPPVATATPTPTPTATATPRLPRRTPTPTATPRPGETPVPTPEPTATPTPTPTPVPVVSEPRIAIVIPIAVFQDDNQDARRQPAETGLAGLRVRVETVGWTGVFSADVGGLVTVTLPWPGEFTIFLADRRPGWAATTRMAVSVRVGEDGSVVLLPGNTQDLPVGLAEGVALAFGLTPPPALWPFILILSGILVWISRKLSYVRIAESVRQYAATERQIYQMLEEE
jgi:hypothetical protein